MRMTELFGRTLREAPADAEGAGWQLLQRAGYARGLGTGRYAYLPLGRGSLDRLAAALPCSEAGGRHSQLEIPALTGAQLAGLARAVAGSDIQSYRQLPVRASGRGVWRRGRSQGRGGPLSASEAAAWFYAAMDGSEEAAAASYEAQKYALHELFRRCGLPVILAADPTSPVAGHAYLRPSEDGADAALLCDGCGYAALADVAAFSRPPVEPETPLLLEKIATPHTSTIADLARLLGIAESRTAKAVFLVAAAEDGEQFVFAVVRGDTDVSERKLTARLAELGVRVSSVRPASDAEIRATGATPGYASPIGLPAGQKNVRVVVDELAAHSPNLVAGANEDGFHLLNTNYGRDYTASIVGDIAAARPGDGCPVCSSRLRGETVAVLARSERLPVEKGGPAFLDATGRAQPVLISVLALDLGALLTAVAETQCDAHGLSLPPAAAAFVVHLVSMPGGESEAEALYQALWSAGLACLWDDRGDSAGVKFTDADLIGAPLRITLGKRSLQSGGAEFKRRSGTEKWIVPLDQAVESVRQALAEIEAGIVAGAKELPYGEYLR